MGPGKELLTMLLLFLEVSCAFLVPGMLLGKDQDQAERRWRRGTMSLCWTCSPGELLLGGEETRANRSPAPTLLHQSLKCSISHACGAGSSQRVSPGPSWVAVGIHRAVN